MSAQPITQPPIIDATAAPAPAAAEPAKPTLFLRARVATGKAVVTLFASARTAQSTAIKKSLEWLTAADTRISKSLVVGEQFLLSRLRVTPE
jgi:hypothetical protein